MEKVTFPTLNAVIIDGSKHSVCLASGHIDVLNRLASQLFPLISCSLEILDEQGRVVCAFVRVETIGAKYLDSISEAVCK